MRPSPVSDVELLRSIISSKPTRFILNQLVKKCKIDGDSRVEVALELIAGTRKTACLICTHIVTPLVKKIIAKGAQLFGSNENDVREQFKQPYWRKGVASALKGIAKFGARKPFTPGAPLLIVWDFTYRCNLRCKHCYSSAGLNNLYEMDTNEALLTVEKLADADVTSLAFSGGEPLMRKDFFEVARAAYEHGMYTALATNGTLITREIAKKLKESGIKYVQISLDGAKPETHNSFRGTSWAYERTLKGIRNCIEEGLFVEIATTVTKLNYNEIWDIIDLCKKLGVPWLMAYNFIPTGRGRDIIKLDLTPMEREELLRNFIKQTYMENKLTLLSTAPQYARIAIQIAREYKDKALIMPTHFCNIPAVGKVMEIADFIGGCGAGRIYCAIEPDGSIQPCVFMPIKIGNIIKDDFEDLWYNNQVFNDLRNRDKLKGNCGKCEFKYICGGCRARAYAYFNDYLAPDPGCIRNEIYWRRITCQ